MRTSTRSFAAAALALLGLAPVIPSANAAERPDAHSVRPALQPFVDDRSLAGAVALVATSERVLTLEAVGYADLAARKRMPTDALFWIASQTKPMTAAGLMMLVDEGKVSVDDPVERYLPEFRRQMVAVERDDSHVLLRKPAHPITIREILSHTSGLPFRSPLEEPALDGLALRDAVRSYALLPLQFEPGTKYEYSNAGINTAARVIEVVSGHSYESFMEERLFKPLKMKDTTFWPSPGQLRRLAKSYQANADHSDLEETLITQLTYPLSDRDRRPMPAGGLFSTAADLARFCQMILNGGVLDGRRYLSSDAIRQMTSKQTGDMVSEGYGFGWSMRGDSYGHHGAYATSMEIDPQRGLVTVLLMQHASFPRQDGAAIEKAFSDAVRSIYSNGAAQ